MSLPFRIALAVVFAVAGGLLFLLSAAAGNQSSLDAAFPALLASSVALALVMALLTAMVGWRAYRRVRQKVYGSRLMVRLAAAFIAMAFVPVMLVSLVSVQFLSKSIESWFSSTVDNALSAGTALGNATLRSLQTDALGGAQELARLLEGRSDSEYSQVLTQLATELNGVEIAVLNEQGRVISMQSGRLGALTSQGPTQEGLRNVRAQGQYVVVEPRPDAPTWAIQVRALARIDNPAGNSKQRYVQWVGVVPERLAKDLDALNAGYSDYKQLVIAKLGIQKIYGTTLGLAILVAVFGAFSAAVLLSTWLATPLRALQRATQAVAEGDYPTIREAFSQDHEINDLVKAFNNMTRQLAEARRLAGLGQARSEEASRFLSHVLSHLSSGVVVLDKDWRIIQANPGVLRLLGLEGRHRQWVAPGEPFSALPLLGALQPELQQRLQDVPETQKQLEGLRPDGTPATLLLSATRLSTEAQAEGEANANARLVLVFDDIGPAMAAERSRTWADVARRLAHEIKNPLMPIQLSAERLMRKLGPVVSGREGDILVRSGQTIVEQVQVLKTLVDEFRNYARLPVAELRRENLSAVVQDLLPLYATDPRIQSRLADECWAMLDRTQLIQVIHNLILNAQEAMGDAPGKILITTHVQTSPEGPRVVLRVDDEGPGLSPELASRIFEPYVSSKLRGSGLGLAIVKKIVEEHDGQISLRTRLSAEGLPQGARAEVVFAQHYASADNAPHG